MHLESTSIPTSAGLLARAICVIENAEPVFEGNVFYRQSAIIGQFDLVSLSKGPDHFAVPQSLQAKIVEALKSDKDRITVSL